MIIFYIIPLLFSFVLPQYFFFRKHPQYLLIFEPESMQEFFTFHLSYLMENTIIQLWEKVQNFFPKTNGAIEIVLNKNFFTYGK